MQHIKTWQLRALVQGHGRALRYIYSDERIGSAGNYFKWDADDRWTPDNPNGTKPRAYERIEEYWRGSHRTDYHYADVSYARLKNLQLSYLIPKTMVDKIGIADAKVYVAGLKPVFRFILAINHGSRNGKYGGIPNYRK